MPTPLGKIEWEVAMMRTAPAARDLLLYAMTDGVTRLLPLTKADDLPAFLAAYGLCELFVHRYPIWSRRRRELWRARGLLFDALTRHTGGQAGWCLL